MFHTGGDCAACQPLLFPIEIGPGKGKYIFTGMKLVLKLRFYLLLHDQEPI